MPPVEGPPLLPETHLYLSTACLHELHDYCAAMSGYQGAKRPAQCKFCDARCVCRCHHDAHRLSRTTQPQ